MATTTSIEMKSKDGRILLKGTSNPNKKEPQMDLVVYLNNFGSPNLNSDLTADEVKDVSSFLSQLGSLRMLELVLPPVVSPTFYATVVLALLQIYHRSSAKELAVTVNLSVEGHTDFLARDDCKSHVRRMGIYGNHPPLDKKKAAESLQSMKKLQFLQLNTVLRKDELLSFLSEVKFSRRFLHLSLEHVKDQKDAKAVVSFLKKQKKCGYRLTVKRVNNLEAMPLLLSTVTVAQDDSVGLVRLEISINYFIVAEDTSFITALESTILNLSPRVKDLSLDFEMGITPSAKTLLKEKLGSAMARNANNGTLALQKFTFKAANDQELSRICSAFAAKQKIARAASGTSRLPRALLPRALKAIKSHPRINPEMYSTTMLFQYMRNDLGLIQHMAAQTKNRKRDAQDHTEANAPRAKHPRV